MQCEWTFLREKGGNIISVIHAIPGHAAEEQRTKAIAGNAGNEQTRQPAAALCHPQRSAPPPLRAPGSGLKQAWKGRPKGGGSGGGGGGGGGGGSCAPNDPKQFFQPKNGFPQRITPTHHVMLRLPLTSGMQAFRGRGEHANVSAVAVMGDDFSSPTPELRTLPPQQVGSGGGGGIKGGHPQMKCTSLWTYGAVLDLVVLPTALRKHQCSAMGRRHCSLGTHTRTNLPTQQGACGGLAEGEGGGGKGGGQGCIGRGALQGAQPMPSHCLPDGNCQLRWHL